MDISEILGQLLYSPELAKVYRDLARFYEKQGMLAEFEAFQHLIDLKFGKKKETPDASEPGR